MDTGKVKYICKRRNDRIAISLNRINERRNEIGSDSINFNLWEVKELLFVVYVSIINKQKISRGGKMMKKIILMATSCMLLLSVAFLPVEASQDDYQKNIEAGKDIQEFLNIVYQKDTESMYSLSTENDSSATYAGAWIDEYNNPHVAFTENAKSNINFSVAKNTNNVEVSYHKHSLNDLLEFQEQLIPLQIKGIIVSTEIKEDTNSINIGYFENTNLNDIKTEIEHLNTKDIKVTYEIDELVEPHAAYGGSKITSSGNGSCSVGMAAKDITTGTFGFVTAGHCYSVGTTTNYGKVTKRSYGTKANMDAEFVAAGVTYKKDISGYSYTSVGEAGIYQGSIVRINTWKQKSSGSITTMFGTATYSSNGTVLTNVIRHNGYSIGGMSGGVAISGNQAVGIHVAGHTTTSAGYNGVIVKGSAVFKSLGLSNN